MIKNIFKTLGLSLAVSSALFASNVQNIDDGATELSLKNNTANILSFPFIVKDGSIASSTADNFQVKVNKYSIVVIPTAEQPSERADLIVTASEGYTYLVKLNVSGSEQTFELTTNKVHNDSVEATEFETGEIDSDVRKLLKLVLLNKDIPGYRKVEVNRQFVTPDMLMQKQTIIDGSKYRVEKWFLKNETQSILTLDESSFYTKGILAIAFGAPKIPVNSVVPMFLIIDKSSLSNQAE
jgi:hypothetical protein